MANILSLAMKINADASGVVKNLTPAERALARLQGEADKVTKVFDEFAGTSQAAATAQASAAKSIADLSESLKRGEISAKEFADNYARLTEEINKEAAAFKRAAQITEANLSPAEKYDRIVAELDEQLRAGRISQETFNRAMEKAQTDLNGVSKSAANTKDEVGALSGYLKFIAGLEIAKLIGSGIQALANIFSDITNRVASLVTSVNSSIDTLNDFSARTGIGVEALQGYSLAAKLAGVDTEQFGAAVQKLAVNIGKATPGDALDKALKGINLSLAELRALSPEQQFSEIGNAISQLPTAADRAAAAVAIFGKQGAALAPLFREGAASIEELQAKAERLGIIISETQVGNVAEMNDAFDLVRATIDGIIGQVLGNLAPAVTNVTNQFLKFVEEWSGAQGEGGTGIANAITDVLLKGAEYFASVFDEFLNRFDGLGITLQDTSATFVASANAFTFVSEGLRTVANVFELAGNALAAALGKIIETLGSFVDSDLEAYGKELTRQAMIATEQNSRQLEEAAANAGKAFVGIFAPDGSGAENAGKGAAESYLSGLAAEIKRQRSPEVKIQASLGDAKERLEAYFKTAEDGGSTFFQQSADTVALFQKMAEEGQLTAAQIQIMNGFMNDLNGKLDQEIAKRQEAAEAAAALAESDKKRIDQMLQTNDAAVKIEQDMQAVERDQARVSEELAAARAADNQTQADAAAARQGELDQLQAKLEEQQQALEQGFGQGFTDAFNAVNQNIDGLIAKSQEFGQAGFDAAMRLQDGIAEAQQQAKDGILNAEAYQQEVQRQQDLYNKELERLDDIKKKKKQDAEDLAKEEERRGKELVKAQEDYKKQQEQALQAYQQQQAKAQEEYAKEQQRIFEEQRKAAEAEAKRQEERLRKLNTLGAQSIAVQDIRNTEGANLVVQLAAGAQDPRLIQERMQTKLLEKIAEGIGQAASNYFRTPVAIVGYADVGGI